VGDEEGVQGYGSVESKVYSRVLVQMIALYWALVKLG